jgi:hypothetical protein
LHPQDIQHIVDAVLHNVRLFGEVIKQGATTQAEVAKIDQVIIKH